MNYKTYNKIQNEGGEGYNPYPKIIKKESFLDLGKIIMDNETGYKTGDKIFDNVFENSLNGIDPETLTDDEIEIHENWILENWEDLMGESGK